MNAIAPTKVKVVSGKKKISLEKHHASQDGKKGMSKSWA